MAVVGLYKWINQGNLPESSALSCVREGVAFCEHCNAQLMPHGCPT